MNLHPAVIVAVAFPLAVALFIWLTLFGKPRRHRLDAASAASRGEEGDRDIEMTPYDLAISRVSVEVVLKDLSAEHVRTDEDPCTICLEDLQVEVQELFVAPECHHGFHMVCISKWIASRGRTNCPNCTIPLLKETEVKPLLLKGVSRNQSVSTQTSSTSPSDEAGLVSDTETR